MQQTYIARGELVKELSLLPMVRMGPLRARGERPVILTTSVEGGALPLRYRWSMRHPGRKRFYRIPDGEGRAWHNQLVWTPNLAGTYWIRVEVHHPGGHLAPVSRTVSLAVAPRKMEVCSNYFSM